jgi:hypothetical protein
MRFYLLKKGREFVIYKVKEEFVFEFLEKYHREILLEAASLMQLLILFERDWLFGVEFSN